MIQFILVQNLQGRTRAAKWYMPCDQNEKHRIEKDVYRFMTIRDAKFTNFVEFTVRKQTYKLIYRRYASLFFIFCVDSFENELSMFETIHLFVEVLDLFFGGVCEMDLVHNFNKVYSLIDEMFLGGQIQEMCVEKIVGKVQDDDKAAESQK